MGSPKSFTKLALTLSLVSLTSCLNSASKSSSATQSESDLGGISPWTVRIAWAKSSNALNYKVFSLESDSKPLIETPFLEAQIPVKPESREELKVYRYGKDGEIASSKPHRVFTVNAWKPFASSSPWEGQTQEYAGIQIQWTHLPWETSDLLPAPSVEDNVFMKCYFLPNGTLSSDPFVSAAVTVQAPVKNKVLKTGSAVSPLTRYAVGCEVVYPDGRTSRHPLVREITSSTELSDDSENAYVQMQPSKGILVSRALSFFANNATNGLLDLSVNWVNGDNVVEDKVLGVTRGNLKQNELITFDSPFPTIPNKVYGGKFRIQGQFTSTATGLPKAIGARDFYVKTADDESQVVHAVLDHVLGAQGMGSSSATGDFNCDGHDDLAIGLPNATWQDSAGKVRNTGVVLVYYGSREGLFYGDHNSIKAPPPSRTPGPVIASGNVNLYPPLMLVPDSRYSDGMPWGQGVVAESNVRFGASLAVGNFNRDFASAPTTVNALPNTIGGRPCQDLAIGAPGLYVPGGPTSDADPVLPSAGGGVYIRYGSPSGLSNGSVAAVSRPFTDFNGSCPGSETSNDPNTAQFHPSASQAAIDRIVPRYYHPTASCSGTLVYPFSIANNYRACVDSSGSSFSLATCQWPTGLDVSENDSSPNADRHSWYKPIYRTSEFYPFVPQAPTNLAWLAEETLGSGSQFGAALSVGDLDGDGFDDLAIGAPKARGVYTDHRGSGAPYARGGRNDTNTGAAFVYFGGTAGIRHNLEQRPSIHTEECGTELSASCASPSTYATGTGAAAGTQPSPIKFTLPYTARVGGELFGSALTIANTNLLRVGSNTLETRDNANLRHTGQLWIGAPGHGSARGAVFVFQPFELSATRVRSVQQKYAWAIQGDQAGSAFGTAITAGNFRDPRWGRVSPSAGNNQPSDTNNGNRGSIGLDYVSRGRIREALAVGSPGYSSDTGRVYVFAFDEGDAAKWPMPSASLPSISTASSLASNRVQAPLCTSSQVCPGSVIPSPAETGARFGASLSTIRQPLEMIRCQDVEECSNALLSDNSALAGVWQPVFSVADLDMLIVGAPQSNSSRGRSYLYRSSIQQGLDPSSGFEHSAPLIASGANSLLGSSGTGGYYNFFWANPGLAIGAPGQDKFGPAINNRPVTVSQGGSVALFEPLTTSGPTPIETSVDLALKTPDPSGGAYFSISSLPTTGFERARFVGDLNCDGYSDVVLPHYRSQGAGLRTELLILYGSPSGLVTTRADGSTGIPVSRAASARMISDSKMGLRAPQWIDTSNWTFNPADSDPLKFFSGVGSIDGDSCDDLVVAHRNYVILHGSDSGLVVAAPSESPINRNPKLIRFPLGNVAIPNGAGTSTSVLAAMNSIHSWSGDVPSSDRLGSLATPPNAVREPDRFYQYDFDPSNRNLGAITSTLQPTLVDNRDANLDWMSANQDLPGAMAPICHGDFNGDGFGDVAVGSMSNVTSRYLIHPSPGAPADQQATYNYMGENQGLYANAAVFVFYGSSQGLQTSVQSNDHYDFASYGTTTLASDANAMLEGSPLDSNCRAPSNAGSAGQCRPALLFDPYQFIVATPSTGSGVSDTLKHYEPYRPWRESHIRYARALRNSNVAASSAWSAILDRFGELCVSPGDLDNDGFDDLVVPLPRSASRPGSFVLFRGSARGLRNGGATEAPVVTNPARVVRVHMSSTATTTDAQVRSPVSGSTLSGAGLGAAGAGLGDLNADFFADFALGMPDLEGQGTGSGVLRNGSVALFYGATNFGLTSPQAAEDSLVARDLPLMIASHRNVLSKYVLCDKPGKAGECRNAQTALPTGGALLRPDTFDSRNHGQRFGLYVESAGDVNGDKFTELLVPMPSYNPPGMSKVGAGFVYFGRSGETGSIDAGWEDNAGTYSPMSPSENSNCDRNGRCRPFLLVPEFALGIGSKDNQEWHVHGGMLIRSNAAPRSTRYRFADFGTRNIYSQDAATRSNDLVLAPKSGISYKYKPGYDHLGGLQIWY
jgi:hypothetical protein